MNSEETPSLEQAAHSARGIVELGEAERVALFHSLRRSKRLSATVRSLNALSAHAQHRALALDALRRLGLGTPG